MNRAIAHRKVRMIRMKNSSFGGEDASIYIADYSALAFDTKCIKIVPIL